MNRYARRNHKLVDARDTLVWIDKQPFPIQRDDLNLKRRRIGCQRCGGVEIMRADPGHAAQENDREQWDGPDNGAMMKPQRAAWVVMHRRLSEGALLTDNPFWLAGTATFLTRWLDFPRMGVTGRPATADMVTPSLAWLMRHTADQRYIQHERQTILPADIARQRDATLVGGALIQSDNRPPQLPSGAALPMQP